MKSNASINHLKEYSFLLNVLNESNANGISKDEIDANKLTHLINEHRIIGPVFHRIENVKLPILESHIKQTYESNKLNQLELIRELFLLNNALKNIDFIALKGPILSQYLYGDPTERSSRDLDILLREDDLDPCIESLSELGYTCLTYFDTPKQKAAIVKHYHHLEFYHPSKGTIIEVHWKLSALKTAAVRYEDCSLSLEKITVSETEFQNLSDKELLIYLSTHGVFHSFFRLQWLHDIRLLVTKLSNDELKRILSKADASSRRCILSTLHILERIFPNSLQSDFYNALPAPRSIGRFVDKIEQRIRITGDQSIQRLESKRFYRMMNNHRTQFFVGGCPALFKSIVSRNVRPNNWKFFAFPDRVFFLNHLFSRVIWLVSKLKK